MEVEVIFMPSLAEILAQREQIEIKKAELELEREKLRIKSESLLLKRTLGDSSGKTLRYKKNHSSGDERVLSFMVYLLGVVIILASGLFFAFKNNLLTTADLQRVLYYDLSPKLNQVVMESKRLYQKISNDFALEPIFENPRERDAQSQNYGQTHFYK
ncbi:MAG: hypothetical protein ACRCSK_01430 [Fusobacteriaceae bacterium]